MIALWISLLGLFVRDVYAGYCTQSYQYTCYKSEKYYTSCGFFGWGRCKRHRTVSHSCTRYEQVCCSGYTGSSCNTPLCEEPNSCLNGGTCQSPNMCSCPNGYSSPRCNDINECASRSHGCKQTCVNTRGSYYCTCRTGYTLSSDLKSCIDLNECNNNNGGCSQTCNNNVGSYTCSCRSGYRLGGRTCYDIDECILGTSGCEHQCRNTVGSYICSCNTGYILAVNGKQCEDIDECAEDTAVCKGYCNNNPGSYTCYCSSGFILEDDGYSCKDLDECAIRNGNCDQKCINEPGSHRCECYSGYRITEGTSGNVCKDIDECSESSARCTQICNNIDGSYTCSCNLGYYLDTDGYTCSDTNDCEGVTCENGGYCVDRLNSYTCICETGFSGQHCETDINECEYANGGCQDICINTEGSFQCNCSGEDELQDDGVSCAGGEAEKDTVFKRLEITRQLLPKPCFTVLLVSCTDGNDINITLSSTSEWYRLTDDIDVMYTLGIVFVKVNDFSIPMSLKGIEVTLRNGEFVFNYGVQYGSAQGTLIENDLTPEDCRSFELVEADFFDFTNMDSFMKMFLLSLFPALPDWLRFEKSSNEILSVQDIRSDIIYGRNMDGVSWCTGAPLLPDHLYTVFRFDTGFTLSVMGSEVDIPKPLNSRKFCLIVDLCHSYGGTVFLMIPEESRNFLLDLNIFQTLKEEQNIHILPRGIGISLVNGINANYHTLSNQLWNGDLMFKPLLPEVDFWIGGSLIKYDEHFTVDGNADIYLGVPSVQTMLTSIFREEWTGLVDIQLSVSPVLRFRLLGNDYSISLQLVTASLNTYISIGGSNRKWCGEDSNPQGIFLSAMVEINPFKGVPFLEDFLFSSTNRLHIFVTTDPLENPLEEINFNITHDILEVDTLLNNAVSILDEAIDDIELALSEATKAIVVEIKESVVAIKNIITVNFNDLLSGNFEELKGHLEDIRQNFYQLRSAVYNFADETEFIVNEAKDNFTDLLESHVKIIEENIRNIFNEITNSIISSVGNYTGVGLKFTTDWKIFGLKLIGFDLEIVYSKGDLFRCSRFEEVKQLLDGENALHVLGRASNETKLGKFLKYEKGFGVGGAFAINSKNVILHLQAFVSMLGIKATGDLFISRNGIYFYLEGNVWDIFLAQIEVTAEVGKEWYQLTFNLRGRFVAKARRKRHLQEYTENTAMQYKTAYVFRQARERRQVQSDSSSFQDSYLDALKKAIRLVSEEAQKRLSQAQAALTSAQSGLTKAQNWLDEKQTAVRDANIIFDNAVEKLERVKEKLEAAKGPLKEAIKKLEDAQKSVDNLCRIKTCSKICIPGLRCKTCHKRVWGVKIPLPCCRFTSCMISFPNPLCVLANLACRIIRAAAYILLEIAKIFVRTAMLAFDVAKAAVPVAQFVVDKSRVVLVVAEGILELAKTGLEVAKVIFEAAKVALEAVKLVIGAAVRVLEFVIEYGLKSIIDVRNCGFNIELSTHDLPAFEVSCEVNAFRLGWTEIKLKINFKNILQSIWQAARATIKAIIDIFGGIFSGRKRRDIEFDGASRMHVLLRKIRESGGLNNTDTYLNETINIINNITGFRDTGDSDAENRIELFHEKCIAITVIQDFMQDAFDSLQGVVNESKSYIDEIDNVKMQLQQYTSINATTENVTADSVGISTEYAANDYNMTEEDIDKAINDSKAAAADDPLLNEIQSAANISVQSVDAEKKAVESVDYQSAWFSSMKNMTREYFNESECENFQDCIFYAISSLYALYESEDLPNITNIQESVLELESILIETFQNESSSIMDTSIAMEYVVSHIKNLVSMNLFCSKAPQFLTNLQNQTALNGTDVQFYCHVTGDPVPDYTWFKNDIIIAGTISSKITITNVTERDTFDKYNCVAGNVVANVTSNDGYITVVLEDEDECLAEGTECQHVCNNTIGSYTCSCYNGYMLEENGISCSDLNECNEDNGGCKQTCNNTEGSFTCSCNTGYQLDADRRTCNDINECLTNNGGCQHTCSNLAGTLACVCNDGFELNIDEKTCNDINECLTNDGGCQHKCINKEGSFTCSCGDGYELHSDRTTCIDINECLTNDGGCQHKCINEEGSFTCYCDDGYELHTDERTCSDINECLSNNGGCRITCFNVEGSFTCSCDDGYDLHTDGTTCIDINECVTNKGGCQHKCVNAEGSFTCSCDDGYKLHTDGRTCIDMNECLINMGGCHHKCVNEEGSFTCSCDDGYELHTDGTTCNDINECLTNKGGCQHKCANEEGSFTCSCDDGYEPHTDGATCIDINECLTNKGGCQHKCVNEEGSFTCSCDDGYELQNDNRTCNDINECLSNKGGCQDTCLNEEGSFKCFCDDGYKLQSDGTTCIDINECLTDKGGCQHKCIIEKGSFTCSCNDGYELHTDGTTCIDINECLTNKGGCQHTCNNTKGSFTCSCDDGYELHTDGRTCNDINKCLTNNGGCQHTCLNEVGTFRCSCDDGYELHTDGTTCNDVNECITKKGGCQHTCLNVEGSFTCSCDDGYKLHTDERTCNDINECLTGNGGCHQTCSNTEGSFICSCIDGFEFYIGGKQCLDINECETNKGGCEHSCSNTEGSFKCTCNNGYELQNDEKSCTDVNECYADNGNCDHACINMEGSYKCSCKEGYELQNDAKSCTDVNECQTNNGGCLQMCMNTNGSFVCSCYNGFYLQNDGKTCSDVQECLTNNGGCEQMCENTEGSFKCMCWDGYELHPNGLSCVDINECAVDKGKCGDRCHNFFGTYTCACPVKHILKTDGLTCTDVSKRSVSSSIRLALDDETAISNYTVYVEIQKMLDLYFRTVIAAPLSVFVNNLRRGSVIADYTVVFDEKDVNGTADLIVQAIIDLEDGGTLVFDEKQTHVKSLLPVSATDPCDVREQLAGHCEEGFYCEVHGGNSSCRKVSDSIHKDYNMIYAVTGVIGFLLLLVLLCARQIRLYRNKERHLNGMTINSSKTVQDSGDYEDPPYLNRKDLIWNFRRKAPSSSSTFNSAGGARMFSWLKRENDLGSTY